MGSITRAIGAFITDKTAVTTFADETANRQYTYPCVDVALVGSEEVRVFAGRVTYYEKDPVTGHPTFAVKETKLLDSLLLTVKTKATVDGSSEAECVKIRNLIKLKIQEALHGASSSVVRDPEAPGDEIGVYRMGFGAIAGPVSDLSGEPKLHVATMELEIQRRERIRRAMTTYVKSTKIDHIVHEVTT